MNAGKAEFVHKVSLPLACTVWQFMQSKTQSILEGQRRGLRNRAARPTILVDH